MSLIIREDPIDRLDEHAAVPIVFEVSRALDVSLADQGLGGIVLTEVAVHPPWQKDYDAIEGEGPTRWAKRFDVTNWGLLAAFDGERRIGGAVVAFDTPGVSMLRGRRDLAVLWDIRVRPEARSAGAGTLLFRAAEGWALERGCNTIHVETQNVNLPACRFYARMGCQLGAIDRFAYPELPDEVQLLWIKKLESLVGTP